MPILKRPGARVWYDVTGSGSPLLIIQGLGYPSDASWRIVRPLSAHHSVILLDNRGVGRSSVPSEPFSILDMAGDAAAAVEAAGLGPAHVAGFSLGGLVAQELRLRRPELVRTLVLGCTSPGGKHAIPLEPEVAEQFMEWSDTSAGLAARRAARVAYSPQTPRAMIETDIAVRMKRPTARRGYMGQLRAVGEYEGSFSRLRQIKQEVLIVQGTKDLIVPPDNAAVLAKGIPHARTVMLQGAGHILMTDATDDLVNAILSFAQEHDGVVTHAVS